MSTTRHGFTLIELLVVIAIISMLASIIMPSFTKAREKARQSSCLSNQRQISLACMLYTQDHTEKMPDSATVWAELAMPDKVLRCPTYGNKGVNSYVYNNMVSGIALAEILHPENTLCTTDGIHRATESPKTYDNILYTALDMDRRHDGQALCGFVDGHVASDSTLTGFWYANDFEGDLGDEWINGGLDTTPSGQRKFLGRFGQREVRLVLLGLPKHDQVRVSFDLFAIGALTGNELTQDGWSMAVDDPTQIAINTNFNNASDQFDLHPQAYPGNTPNVHPARTGAAENDTLGYAHDAVYPITVTFDHNSKSLVLIFTGVAPGWGDTTQKSWGLDDIEVLGKTKDTDWP